MSEGTPGRGPDADSRTDTGDGQAPTNGRPAVPPVRYGPRNGSPANGANGRTASGPSTPQQYRGPQPPRTPANGSSPNGTGANGSGSNGSGSNGARPVTPSSYTRPRTNGNPARPEPTEQERLVADARIAAAARNASAAKVRGGSALSGSRHPAPVEPPKTGSAKTEQPTTTAPVDETAVIPVVGAEEPAVVKPADAAEPSATTDETTPEKRNVFGRLRTRDRRGAKDPEAPVVSPESTDAVTVATPEAKDAEPRSETTTDVDPDKVTEPESSTEPAETAADAQDAATQERPLTWRDRLGLPPKAPKPESTDAPETGTVVPAAAAGAAVAVVAAGSGSAETVTPLQDRVSPSPFAPATASDTLTIPAVDATGAPAPAAGATALPVVAAPAPRPKVGAARRTRKARLRLSRVDPWSVMKTALLFSIAAGIILVVATYGVWSVLNASGLFDAINDMVKSVVSTPGDTTPFRIEEYVNTQKIIGVAALIAVVDVLIFTALATLGSFLYNLAATVLGGLEVTLAED